MVGIDCNKVRRLKPKPAPLEVSGKIPVNFDGKRIKPRNVNKDIWTEYYPRRVNDLKHFFILCLPWYILMFCCWHYVTIILFIPASASLILMQPRYNMLWGVKATFIIVGLCVYLVTGWPELSWTCFNCRANGEDFSEGKAWCLTD